MAGDGSAGAIGDGGTCSNVVCDACAFYVDVGVATAGDGKSPAQAFRDVQSGIDAAAKVAGDCCRCDVLIAEGDYFVHETRPEDTIALAERVDVYGGYPPGFAGSRDPVAHEVVLDGRSGDIPVADSGPPPLDAGRPPLDAGVPDGGFAAEMRVYHVVTGANDALLDGVTIAYGNARSDYDELNLHNYGGGMLNVGVSPTVSACVFRSNDAVFGGGMYNVDGVGVVIDTTFVSNNAVVQGGGVDNRHTETEFTNCTFERNWAPRGGGMFNGAGSQPMLNRNPHGLCRFDSNQALDGAGMYNHLSAPAVDDCTFIGNLADAGGGVYNDESDGQYKNATFDSNRVGFIFDMGRGSGGGMHNRRSQPLVEACTFVDNEAFSGGGVANDRSPVIIDGCTFLRNRAEAAELSEGGGGVFNGTSDATISGSLFEENYSGYNGAGIGNIFSEAVITGCVFRNNTSNGGGGGVSVWQRPVTLANSVFVGNSAYAGGGMSNGADPSTVVNCTFYGNDAQYGGGLVKTCTDTIYVINSIFWANTATTEGPQVDNHSPCSAQPPPTIQIRKTAIEGGCGGTGILCGPGNVSDDPLLDPVTLKPAAGSPCIDVGDDTAVVGDVDPDGNPRIADGDGSGTATVDLGAYERPAN